MWQYPQMKSKPVHEGAIWGWAFSELEVIAPLPMEVPQRHPELQQVSYRGNVRARDVNPRVFGHTFKITKEVKIEHD